MTETIKGQIERLTQVLERTAQGTPLPEDMPLLEGVNQGLPLDQQLLALNMAVAQNMMQAIKNRHEQIAVAMAVSKYVTFFARQITPDVAFWTEEVNGDISLQTDLLVGAQQDIETILAAHASDPEVQQLTTVQNMVVTDFNNRQQRRISGQTLYDTSEYPADADQGSAETKVRHLRQTQFREAFDGIQILTNRALFAAMRIHFVTSTILPLFQKTQDPAADTWKTDINVTLKQGQEALAEADNLHTHLTRLQRFGTRLDAAKPPKPE